MVKNSLFRALLKVIAHVIYWCILIGHLGSTFNSQFLQNIDICETDDSD